MLTLAEQGYCRVSNRYRHLSRIDRPDWLQVLARHLRCSVAELCVEGTNEVAGSWADHYRRCISKDVITVSEAEFRTCPSSGHNPIGYCPKPGEPPAHTVPPIIPRRPLDEEDPDGYLESDRDFVLNNLEACVWFLESGS